MVLIDLYAVVITVFVSKMNLLMCIYIDKYEYFDEKYSLHYNFYHKTSNIISLGA